MSIGLIPRRRVGRNYIMIQEVGREGRVVRCPKLHVHHAWKRWIYTPFHCPSDAKDELKNCSNENDKKTVKSVSMENSTQKYRGWGISNKRTSPRQKPISIYLQENTIVSYACAMLQVVLYARWEASCRWIRLSMRSPCERSVRPLALRKNILHRLGYKWLALGTYTRPKIYMRPWSRWWCILLMIK